MKCTTVITSYNRRYCIAKAIDSALRELPDQQIIVVDDASTDGTPKYIRSRYQSEIDNHKLKLLVLKENLGVSGAKNEGYKVSDSDWVLFLDSDDFYEDNVGFSVLSELQLSKDSPIVFFRCRNDKGDFVGQKEGQRFSIDLRSYLRNTSFGEALTAINKNLTKSTLPFIQPLRGYEGIGCARLIRDFGPAILSDVVARVYVTSGSDRLSVRKGFLMRLPLLAKGHFMILQEFSDQLSAKHYFSLLMKALVYFVAGNIFVNILKR